MNPDRRKKVVALPDDHPMDGWAGTARKHLNTALTVILVVAAIAMFINWRVKTAAMNKMSVKNELATARDQVGRLHFGQFAEMKLADLIKAVQTAQTQANASIASVLNSSDSDAAMRAEALTLRGDMNWYLANLPEMPGATTQASLRLSDSGDSYLLKASDAYQEVIKNSTYADQHEQLAVAHMGLAAIAENQHNWAEAQKQLQAVVSDTNNLTVMIEQAKLQLDELPNIQQALYVAPSSGIQTKTIATLGPIAPTTQMATTQPTH